MKEDKPRNRHSQRIIGQIQQHLPTSKALSPMWALPGTCPEPTPTLLFPGCRNSSRSRKMVAASVEFHSVDFQFATTSFKREIELGKSEGDWTNGLLGTPNLLMLLAFFVANRASTSCCAIHSEGEPGVRTAARRLSSHRSLARSFSSRRDQGSLQSLQRSRRSFQRKPSKTIPGTIDHGFADLHWVNNAEQLDGYPLPQCNMTCCKWETHLFTKKFKVNDSQELFS